MENIPAKRGRCMDATNRTQIIAFLKRLTDKQFVELFYEAVEERVILGNSPGDSKLILANASRDSDESGKWEVDLLALHDRSAYDSEWADDVLFCQESESEGFRVLSYAKQMICPITGRSIRGT